MFIFLLNSNVNNVKYYIIYFYSILFILSIKNKEKLIFYFFYLEKTTYFNFFYLVKNL